MRKGRWKDHFSAVCCRGALPAKATSVGAAILLATVTGSPAFADPSPAGIWEQTNNEGKPESWILLENKNGTFDGRYIKFFDSAKQQEAICAKCTGGRKGARILGLTIIYNLKLQKERGKYVGQMIDVKSGSIFHVIIQLDDTGTEINALGCITFPLCMGATRVWNKLPDDIITPTAIPREVLSNELEK